MTSDSWIKRRAALQGRKRRSPTFKVPAVVGKRPHGNFKAPNPVEIQAVARPYQKG